MDNLIIYIICVLTIFVICLTGDGNNNIFMGIFALCMSHIFSALIIKYSIKDNIKERN